MPTVICMSIKELYPSWLFFSTLARSHPHLWCGAARLFHTVKPRPKWSTDTNQTWDATSYSKSIQNNHILCSLSTFYTFYCLELRSITTCHSKEAPILAEISMACQGLWAWRLSSGAKKQLFTVLANFRLGRPDEISATKRWTSLASRHLDIP